MQDETEESSRVCLALITDDLENSPHAACSALALDAPVHAHRVSNSFINSHTRPLTNRAGRQRGINFPSAQPWASFSFLKKPPS
jgi:hypothetical protein